MKNKKNKPIPETTPIDVDALLAPYEIAALRRELLATQLRLMESERKRTEQKKDAQRKLDGIMGFVGVTAGLVVLASCALSSAPWTAVFIALGVVAVMRKAGWI